MRFKKLLLIILFSMFGFSSVYAQWDAQISQYWKIKNFYNPSFIGQTNNLEASLLHRRQWVGVRNAPVTSVVGINMPLRLFGKEHGIGAVITNEKLGLFSNTNFIGQYNYKFKFKKNRVLNIGIQGGLINIDFDANGIKMPENGGFDPQDPAIPANGEDKAIDGGLGASWVTPNYYIGLSATHLWSPSFDLGETSSFIARTYYLVAGYNIKLSNPLIELQPSMLYKTDEVVHQLDITAIVEYNKLFNGGLSWRKDDGFVFLLGVRIKSIEAGYAYDLSTSPIAKVSHGSHEIFLKYSMPLGSSKKTGAHKSIRIL